ncbi:flagellar motor protein MotB [uncultured Brachyspira sp.]|uniref:flagellar motor protein MotB n=1 Tax=uncultured Brachyspira sp. TaxID=221953 RepID=UPI0025F748CB|nr:flagellar motor protein MotB [uncultured Brachyspira sp.]
MATIKFGKKAKKAGDKAQVPGPSAPLWLQTYGDFVTLVLTFFVLLLSTMSTSVSDSSIQLIATAFQGSFGVMTGGSTLSQSKLIYGGASVDTLPSTDRGYSVGKSIDKAVSVLESEIKSRKLRVEENERGFIISLGADRYFESASTNLIDNQNNVETFIKLASILSGLPNDVRIEGHTDAGSIIPGSITEEKFGNNWGLSSARAMVVLEKIFENDQAGALDRNKYSIAGYADTRPMASNDLPDGRALNRRVDIVIVRNDVTYYNQR